MARTNADAVKGILIDQYDLTGLPPLTPFIRTATVLVDRIVAKDSTVAATLLKEIECYLAAHLYGHADQFLQSKSTEGASGQFQGQTAMFFSSTYYGQTAMMLDSTGLLAELEQQAKGGVRKAGATWLGTTFKNDDRELSTDQ